MFDLKKEAGGTLWAGDLASYKEAERLEAACIEAMRTGSFRAQAEAAAGDEEKLPRLYQRQGNVAIVKMRGPMINTENELTAYFGMTTYPAIREAMVFAAADDKINSVLLDIESGGGQVSGVNDTAKLVRKVNTLKPVTSFTGGMAASAAYWIGSAAGKMYADELAIVGSIGVIATHVSIYEALKKDGVEATVMRVGQNKALGHPMEKFTEKAKDHILGQMKVMYDAFTNGIAKVRGLDPAKRDQWANGNEFFGADATEIGLIDGVSSYDQVFAKLQAKAGAVDNPFSANNTQTNNKRAELKTPITAILTAEQLAAIEAGTASAEIVAAAAVIAAEVAAKATTEAAAQAAVEAEAAAKAKLEADTAAKAKLDAEVAAKAKVDADAAATAAAVEAAKVKETDLVAFLRAELKASQESATALAVKVAGLEAQAGDAKDSHAKLCEIARNSVNKMAIALGGTEANLDNLSGVELVTKHAAITASFQKVFKTGGVASTATATDGSKGTAKVVPMHAARVAAVGL